MATWKKNNTSITACYPYAIYFLIPEPRATSRNPRSKEKREPGCAQVTLLNGLVVPTMKLLPLAVIFPEVPSADLLYALSPLVFCPHIIRYRIKLLLFNRYCT